MSNSLPDDIDQAILYYLQQDARRPITDIADDIGVSDNTIRNRIQAMEELGIISGYGVEVNYDIAGVQHHYMFICTARVSKREKLAEEARKLPDITEVITLMTGTHNVYIIGAGREKDDITQLASTIDEIGLAVEREHLIRDHIRQEYSGFSPPEHLPRK